MDYGLCLPNFPDGASREGMEAGAETAQRLGWSTVWTTDHVLVTNEDAGDYGRIYEALLSLAWIGAKYTKVRLGTSVLVVPQRNAVILAKELATLDALTGGRVIAGVGVGWSEPEFANLGAADRFHERGAYLDETIALWRHLWSGSTEPFHGRFHTIDDFAFAPLPERGTDLPIVVGGRADAALRRAGSLGDGYHSSTTNAAKYAVRLPVIRAAAEAAGRPLPWLTARATTEFGPAEGESAVLHGSPEQMAEEVRAFEALGVSHIALAFGVTDPGEITTLAERFARDVAPLV